MVDRPPSRPREIDVEVQGPLRNSGLWIEPEIEAQTFVDIAHADDFVHPGVRKGTILLIMSTRPSAKVSNEARSAYGSRGPRFAGNGASSSIGRFSRNLAKRNGTRISGFRPVATYSAMSRPTSGESLKPWPLKPAATYSPSGPTRSRIGYESGVTSYTPAHPAAGLRSGHDWEAPHEPRTKVAD